MVLEARYNAEKVGYPVVGEKVNDAENVIDYDIHDEITIDSSSVFNANNDTTTGMANVIPGVNAPKLLFKTSIIGGPGGAGQYAVGTGACASNRVGAGTDEDVLPQGTITLSDYTDGEFEISGNDLKVVKGGTYLFSIEQTNYIRSSAASDYYIRTIVTLDGTSVIDGRVTYGPTPFTWNGPLNIPDGGVINVYGMLWHISSAIAPVGGGVEWNISMVRLG